MKSIYFVAPKSNKTTIDIILQHCQYLSFMHPDKLSISQFESDRFVKTKDVSGCRKVFNYTKQFKISSSVSCSLYKCSECSDAFIVERVCKLYRGTFRFVGNHSCTKPEDSQDDSFKVMVLIHSADPIIVVVSRNDTVYDLLRKVENTILVPLNAMMLYKGEQRLDNKISIYSAEIHPGDHLDLLFKDTRFLGEDLFQYGDFGKVLRLFPKSTPHMFVSKDGVVLVPKDRRGYVLTIPTPNNNTTISKDNIDFSVYYKEKDVNGEDSLFFLAIRKSWRVKIENFTKSNSQQCYNLSFSMENISLRVKNNKKLRTLYPHVEKMQFFLCIRVFVKSKLFCESGIHYKLVDNYEKLPTVGINKVNETFVPCIRSPVTNWEKVIDIGVEIQRERERVVFQRPPLNQLPLIPEFKPKKIFKSPPENKRQLSNPKKRRPVGLKKEQPKRKRTKRKPKRTTRKTKKKRISRSSSSVKAIVCGRTQLKFWNNLLLLNYRDKSYLIKVFIPEKVFKFDRDDFFVTLKKNECNQKKHLMVEFNLLYDIWDENFKSYEDYRWKTDLISTIDGGRYFFKKKFKKQINPNFFLSDDLEEEKKFTRQFKIDGAGKMLNMEFMLNNFCLSKKRKNVVFFLILLIKDYNRNVIVSKSLMFKKMNNREKEFTMGDITILNDIDMDTVNTLLNNEEDASDDE